MVFMGFLALNIPLSLYLWSVDRDQNYLMFLYYILREGTIMDYLI